MALHIRLGLGHWPTPMIENYRTIPFQIHEFTSDGILIFTVYCAAPLWLALLLFQRLRLSWRVHLVQAFVYSLGWLMIYLAGKYDTTTFTEWLLD